MHAKRWFWGVCICALILTLIGSFNWAPVDASPLGQTVPTRTPSPAPGTATPAPSTPSETATPGPGTASPTETPAATPALLPVAGGESDGMWLLGGAGLALLALAWILTRRHSMER